MVERSTSVRRGGKRPGAGRPSEGRSERINSWQSPETVAQLRALGGGNVSEGIRIAAEIASRAHSR